MRIKKLNCDLHFSRLVVERRMSTRILLKPASHKCSWAGSGDHDVRTLCARHAGAPGGAQDEHTIVDADIKDDWDHVRQEVIVLNEAHDGGVKPARLHDPVPVDL